MNGTTIGPVWAAGSCTILEKGGVPHQINGTPYTPVEYIPLGGRR